MKERIAKSVFWLVWSRGGVQLLSFLTTLLVARWLNPSDYGLMALASIWTATLGMLADLGLGAAIIQFRDVDDSELNICFWTTMGLAVTGYLALFACAPVLASWFKSPRLEEVLRVVGVTLPLAAMGMVPDALLRKRLELDKTARAEIVAAIVVIPVMLGLAWNGAGVWALVMGVILQSVTYDAVLFWFVRWWPGFRVGSSRFREVLRYSLSTLGTRLAWSLNEQIDVLVLGKLSGDLALGFYSMARQLALMPVTKIAVLVNQVALPALAHLQVDLAALRSSFLRMFRMVACMTIPICVGMTLEADDLVHVALADKWMPSVPILQVSAAGALLHSLIVLFPMALFARYRTGFVFKWTISLLFLMPAAFWAGAAWAGGIGVALAWATLYPALAIWLVRETLKELGLRWLALWEEVRFIVFLSMMMASSVLLVRWALPSPQGAEHLTRLLCASGIGAVLYGIGIFLRGGRIADEIVEVVGWLFRRGRPAPSPE